MWTLESFRTLDLLVAFLNDRKLRADHCKVVAGPGESGEPIYHLLYETDIDDQGFQAREAAVESDLLPVAGIDGGGAVDLAELIHPRRPTRGVDVRRQVSGARRQ